MEVEVVIEIPQGSRNKYEMGVLPRSASLQQRRILWAAGGKVHNDDWR